MLKKILILSNGHYTAVGKLGSRAFQKGFLDIKSVQQLFKEKDKKSEEGTVQGFLETQETVSETTKTAENQETPKTTHKDDRQTTETGEQGCCANPSKHRKTTESVSLDANPSVGSKLPIIAEWEREIEDENKSHTPSETVDKEELQRLLRDRGAVKAISVQLGSQQSEDGQNPPQLPAMAKCYDQCQKHHQWGNSGDGCCQPKYRCCAPETDKDGKAVGVCLDGDEDFVATSENKDDFICLPAKDKHIHYWEHFHNFLEDISNRAHAEAKRDGLKTYAEAQERNALVKVEAVENQENDGDSNED